MSIACAFSWNMGDLGRICRDLGCALPEYGYGAERAFELIAERTGQTDPLPEWEIEAPWSVAYRACVDATAEVNRGVSA